MGALFGLVATLTHPPRALSGLGVVICDLSEPSHEPSVGLAGVQVFVDLLLALITVPRAILGLVLACIGRQESISLIIDSIGFLILGSIPVVDLLNLFGSIRHVTPSRSC